MCLVFECSVFGLWLFFVIFQLKQYRKVCAADLRAEAKRRKELEKEEQKMKELEEFKAQTRANANFKAKIAETEGRLMCTQCQTAMFPDAYGDYEFERWGGLLIKSDVKFA